MSHAEPDDVRDVDEASSQDQVDTRRHRADRLKERVYLAFVLLAVTVACITENAAATDALITVLFTAVGTLLAVFVADLMAHSIVHERHMTARELRGAVASSFGALTTAVVPVVSLLLAVLGAWSSSTALWAAAVALVAALVIAALLAERRMPLSWWQRAVMLCIEIAAGGLVIVLKLVAHH